MRRKTTSLTVLPVLKFELGPISVGHTVLDKWITKISKKKFFHGGFWRAPRSLRSNDLETQNDENSIMKSDKN